MAKKKLAIGVASAVAAGAGAAILLKKKSDVESHTSSSKSVSKSSDYRNTERGKHEKNSKGIYYPTEIMKRLHVRKNLTELMRNTLTL